MGQTMELRLRQHLTLTPQLQQALRLLQLSALEFEQEMREALDTNPFLEEDDESPRPGASGSEPVAEAADAGTDTPTDPNAGETLDVDGRVGLDDLPRSAASHDGDDIDWTEWSEAPLSLHDHLRRQLMLSQMGERDRALAHLVIDALDDDGYLKVTFAELAALVPAEHGVEADDLAAALRLVQTLEPPGIGARSLQECLLLQLQVLPEGTTGRPIALALVGEHFSLLAAREFVRLQHLLGCNESDLHVARTLIRSLNPKPGHRFGPDDTHYVVPDVIVSKVRGRWVAGINPAVLPRIRINRAYADMAGSRASGGVQMSRQLQEARWLIRNMEQRFVTIQRVADAIVAKQRNFFEYGEVAMKPLGLKHIAERARPARVDRLPGDERQVHGDPARPVRVQAVLLAPARYRKRRRVLGDRDPRADEGADRERDPAGSAVRRAARAAPRRTGAARRASHRHQVPDADAPAERRAAAGDGAHRGSGLTSRERQSWRSSS